MAVLSCVSYFSSTFYTASCFPHTVAPGGWVCTTRVGMSVILPIYIIQNGLIYFEWRPKLPSITPLHPVGWTVGVQVKDEKMPESFLAISLPYMIWITSSRDRSVPVSWVCMLAVPCATNFLVVFVFFSLYLFLLSSQILPLIVKFYFHFMNPFNCHLICMYCESHCDTQPWLRLQTLTAVAVSTQPPTLCWMVNEYQLSGWVTVVGSGAGRL